MNDAYRALVASINILQGDLHDKMSTLVYSTDKKLIELYPETFGEDFQIFFVGVFKNEEDALGVVAAMSSDGAEYNAVNLISV